MYSSISEKSKKNLTRELAEELDTFDNMLSAIVELLEEKGIITQEEWEERIKIKTMKATGVKSYRELQFSSEG